MEWNWMFFVNSALLGVGLAMDAFSVSLANGLNEPKMRKGRMCLIAGVFAGFQALMPLFGYLLGSAFEKYIISFDHWIAFTLLAFIGIMMIKESCCKEEEKTDASLCFKTMLLMAIATSIDALAVGVSYGILPNVNIWVAISSIGIITFLFCVLGVKIGNIFGAKYKSKAELVGGIILILIGLKILLEHLGGVFK